MIFIDVLTVIGSVLMLLFMISACFIGLKSIEQQVLPEQIRTRVKMLVVFLSIFMWSSQIYMIFQFVRASF